MTIAVFYNDQMVAVTRDGDVTLTPDIDALCLDHPDRRWVAGLAAFACRVQAGTDHGPYTEEGAAAFARSLLLPVHEFAPRAGWPDRTLAACLRAPVEQVRLRGAELGLTWN